MSFCSFVPVEGGKGTGMGGCVDVGGGGSSV